MRGLLNDIVTVICGEGRIEGVRASVQRKKIFIDDVSIPLEAGDSIERELRSGKIEVLLITNVHQWSGGISIQDYYEIDYERQGARSTRSQPGTVNVTVSDSLQPHINVNSTDQSISINSGEIHPIFEEIRELLRESIRDAEELDRILLSVDAMERSRHDRNEFACAYKKFISVAADHVTLLAPTLTSLVSLL